MRAGPWVCEYYNTTEKGLRVPGEKSVFTREETLSTSWQETTRFGWDGVPELNKRLQDFSVKCYARSYFEPGAYSFLPYLKITGNSSISIDGAVLARVKGRITPLAFEKVVSPLVTFSWVPCD